ncbi:MAG: hypothetical protein NDJ89_01450 [Oligoflexia bacterium]|nr:hypothetical protein [Oligoflexia bacterium]
MLYRPNALPVSEDLPVTQRDIHWIWITMTGRDAQDFLQRLSTADVRNLQPGQGTPALFLTAQGKIRAYFTLWNLAPGAYAFELDGGTDGKASEALLGFIDQYTFAEKFSVVPTEALECRWLFTEPAALGMPELQAGQTRALEGTGIRLCHHGKAAYGHEWLTAWGQGAELDRWVKGVLPQARELPLPELERLRIQALQPRVGVEIDEDAMPLELGLIDAISSNKGCYPGQEVIERIVSLGSPARRLCALEIHGASPAPGTMLLNLADPPAEVGQLTSVDGSGRALALLRKIHAKEGMELRFVDSDARGRVVRVSPYALPS